VLWSVEPVVVECERGVVGGGEDGEESRAGSRVYISFISLSAVWKALKRLIARDIDNG
jgi:hypothetical protein